MNKVILTAIAVCLLFAAPVSAKEGFYLGLFYPSESISGDAGNGVSSGGGWGFRAGMGFNRYIALEGHYSTTSHDIPGGTGDLKCLAGDLKLNFPLTSLDSARVMTLEPYIMAGYAHYEFSNSETVKSDGFQYGIGIELYLFRELSVQAGWTDTRVEFKDGVSAKGDVKTVDFGLTYHFI